MCLRVERRRFVPNNLLTADDVVPGRWYRGGVYLANSDTNNDRYVTWVSQDRSRVQYDSDTVAPETRYPIVPMDRFIAWARRDVTDLHISLAEGED